MNSEIPIITMKTLSAYKTHIDLLDNLPPTVRCDSVITFDELKKRYDEAGISYVVDYENYEIKS